MENREINIAVLEEVANSLAHLKDQMCFVGGAVVSLYADDTAAEEMRPTTDIDMTVHLINFGHWAKMMEELAMLGIHPDPLGPSICRFILNKIPIDIIPSEDSPMGPANSWYKIGLGNPIFAKAGKETIQILSAPCFLATKFEAFNNRGKDYRTSHDIEDIVFILDNRTTLVKEIEASHPEIRKFIQQSFTKIINTGLMEEMLYAHMNPNSIEERLPMMLKKIQSIIG